MDFKDIILIGSCIINAAGAIAVWATKMWWTNEFTLYKQAQLDVINEKLQQVSAAKDETIKAKDAQIEALKNEVTSLRELNPAKLREYFVSTKEQLEEYNDKLKAGLNNSQETIQALNVRIEKMTDNELVDALKNELELKAKALEADLVIYKGLKNGLNLTLNLIGGIISTSLSKVDSTQLLESGNTDENSGPFATISEEALGTLKVDSNKEEVTLSDQ